MLPITAVFPDIVPIQMAGLLEALLVQAHQNELQC